MKTESVQAVRRLISQLEAVPLSMGGGDAEREALVTRLVQVADCGQELSLRDLWVALRLLGSEAQSSVCEAFATIASSEAAALELSSYPVSADNNAADNLVRKLSATKLPLAQAHRRASVVRNFQAYLDNRRNDLAVEDMVDAARLLGEEGYSLVEGLLRFLFIGPLELASSKLWTEVTAHFGIRAHLADFLQGRVAFPKKGGAKSGRMKNLLPHIAAAADAAYCLRNGIDVKDIDALTDGVASKLELVGDPSFAAELEGALQMWSQFKAAYPQGTSGTTPGDASSRGEILDHGIEPNEPASSARQRLAQDN